MCRYNKQVIDSSFLDVRGQSASFVDQQLTKIEAYQKSYQTFFAHPLMFIVCSKYDTSKHHIITINK